MESKDVTTLSRIPSTVCARPAQPMLVPCLNFSIVSAGIYRSGHPNSWNESFLDNLHVKSIMYLASDDYRSFTSNWAKSRNINIFHHRMDSLKDKHTEETSALMASALSQVLDTRNHPILIHCNKGKHRVGLFYGTGKEARQADYEFVETFNLESVIIYEETKPSWLEL